MCGIGGIYDLNLTDSLLLEVRRMSEMVRHRGPDDSGCVAIGPSGEIIHRTDEATGNSPVANQKNAIIALGHRRLAIIDLSRAGHQPMRDSSGRYWLVYNGEIYNYVELRSELADRGHTFRSATDSEVVLQAFKEWGVACLDRFNGMWAFSIYDRETGSLFCARDRYGIKPFFYAHTPGRFAFASEAKQLVSLSWIGSRANHSLLADLLLWGLSNHTDECFFSGVTSLPGSHYLMLSREDIERARIRPIRYWSPVPAEPLDEHVAVQEFRELLFDSVRMRLRSDVPIGFTVSGGLDSSSVLCVAGELRRNEEKAMALQSFNVEYKGEGYSERCFSEEAAKTAGAESTVLRPSYEDLARDWSRFVWHMEQPFSGLSYFSNFQVYRLIRERGIPVVLSGQGGDEILLGYDRYRSYNALFSLKTGSLKTLLAGSVGGVHRGNMAFSKQVAYGLYFSLPWLRVARRRRLTRSILKEGFFREYAPRTEHLLGSMLHEDRHELQASELFRYQLPHLLDHEDRVSMAHSIETRLPFLDYRLLELVLGQPMSLLLRDGWSKYLLRQAMDGTIPDRVKQRTDKMGYETPTRHLILQNRDLFLPLLHRHRDDPVLDSEAMVQRFDSPRLDQRLLCSALTYLTWKEAFSVT